MWIGRQLSIAWMQSFLPAIGLNHAEVLVLENGLTAF
jgi:hypothetical protein